MGVLFLAQQLAGQNREIDADGLVAKHFGHGQDLWRGGRQLTRALAL